MQLQRDAERLNAAGIEIVGVSYDSVQILKKFSTEKKITYKLLSDSNSKVIDAFQIRNKSVRRANQRGIPHPCTYLVSQDSKVAAFLPGTVRTRHSTDELIAEAKKLNAAN